MPQVFYHRTSLAVSLTYTSESELQEAGTHQVASILLDSKPRMNREVYRHAEPQGATEAGELLP